MTVMEWYACPKAEFPAESTDESRGNQIGRMGRCDVSLAERGQLAKINLTINAEHQGHLALLARRISCDTALTMPYRQLGRLH